MKEKEWKKWIYWFTFTVAAILVYKAIDSVSAIFTGITNFFKLLTPFIVAVLVAYMLYIPGKSVERKYIKSKFKFLRKHARGLSTLTVYAIAVYSN